MIAPTNTTTQPAFEIVSFRMRGARGRWGLAHLVYQGETYIRSFAKLADAKRFVREAK